MVEIKIMLKKYIMDIYKFLNIVSPNNIYVFV